MHILFYLLLRGERISQEHPVLPYPEFRMLCHAPQGSFHVLMLAPAVPCYPRGTRSLVRDPDSRIGRILMLPARSTGTERVDDQVIYG